jgi:hypothetical protein
MEWFYLAHRILCFIWATALSWHTPSCGRDSLDHVPHRLFSTWKINGKKKKKSKPKKQRQSDLQGYTDCLTSAMQFTLLILAALYVFGLNWWMVRHSQLNNSKTLSSDGHNVSYENIGPSDNRPMSKLWRCWVMGGTRATNLVKHMEVKSIHLKFTSSPPYSPHAWLSWNTVELRLSYIQNV